ncbi:hypothetical protein MCAMS1_00517 [biofilm metagenome]
MLNKSIKLAAFILLMNTLPAGTAHADSGLMMGEGSQIALKNIAIDAINNTFSIKKGQAYDEANDTAFRTFNGGPTKGPQHGYFAVPLIVIGIAGILLYFSRND